MGNKNLKPAGACVSFYIHTVTCLKAFAHVLVLFSQGGFTFHKYRYKILHAGAEISHNPHPGLS